MSPDPLLKLSTGESERTTARALRRLLPSGGVVLDIGANIGARALPMALLAGPQGRVIAVEPTSVACTGLRENLALINAGALPTEREPAA